MNPVNRTTQAPVPVQQVPVAPPAPQNRPVQGPPTRSQRLESFTRENIQKRQNEQAQREGKLNQLFGPDRREKIRTFIKQSKGTQVMQNARSIPTPSPLNVQMEKARLISSPSLETAKELNTISGALQAAHKSGVSTSGADNANAFGTGLQLAGVGGMAILGTMSTVAGIVDLVSTWKENNQFSQGINNLETLVEKMEAGSQEPVDTKILDQLGIDRQALANVLNRGIEAPINFQELRQVLPTDLLKSSAEVMKLLKNEKASTLTGLTNNKHVTTALTAIKAGADMSVFVAKIAGNTGLAGSAGIAGGITLAVIGTYGMVNDGLAGYKAHSKAERASQFLTRVQGHEAPQNKRNVEDLETLAKKVKATNTSTKWTKAVSFIKNACFTATGVLAAVGGVALGAALLSNPIGWAMLGVGAIGFGIAIGLAVDGNRKARQATVQKQLNQTHQTELNGLKTEIANAKKQRLGLTREIALLQQQINHAPASRKPQLRATLQTKTASLAQVNAQLPDQQNRFRELDNRLLAGDVKYRSQRLLEQIKQLPLQQAPETWNAEQRLSYDFATQVLGFKPQQVQSLQQASTPLAIEMIAKKL